MKKLFLIIAAMMLAMGASAQATFHISKLIANVKSDTASLAVSVVSDSWVKGFQMDLELPASMSAEQFAPVINTNLTGFDIAYKQLSARKFRMLVTSGKAAVLPQDTVEVMKFNVNLALKDVNVQTDFYKITESRFVYRDYTSSQADTLQKTFDVPNLRGLTYMVDSIVYQTDSVFSGDSIVVAAPPVKEGHTFVGWEGLPTVMPDRDVVVRAKFDVNVYRLTYRVDTAEYVVDSIAYAAAIVPPTAPVKKGHTFIGWDGLPDVMPASDVEVKAMFAVNTYRLTYVVDEEEYRVDSIVYAGTIIAPSEPVKEGYTFIGWEGLPTVMPDRDVVVHAKFEVNVYRLTYRVDAAEYVVDSVAYAAAIVPPTAPAKKGHTFVGWDGLPGVMPARDVEVDAMFAINTYRLTYVVGDEEYNVDSIVYAGAIVVPVEPTKEGHTFIGWEGLPSVMPDRDVVVKAMFEVNVYRLTYMVDSQVYYTDSVAYNDSISLPKPPAKRGYLFDGWDGLPQVMPARDVTTQAQFVLNNNKMEEDGLVLIFEEVDSTYTIVGYTDALAEDVVIKSELIGFPIRTIAENALADASINTIVIPATIQEVGDDAFVGCTELRWVDWQAQAQVRAECFDAPEAHGNMLLFCYGEQTPDYAGNVVVNGKAKEIVLMDARPYASPYDFEAENISFTKTFAKETMIGTGAGWEGIVVPFDVERIVFGDKVIAPFGATGQYCDIPCWLAQMKDENFVMTDAIKADEAYIMAVPNSEAYDDDYNVEGGVRFEATNARLKSTSQAATSPASGLGLVGTYEPVEAAANVFTLNDEEYWKTYDGMMAPGSVFVQGLRDVRPFEAYVRSTKALHMACLKIGNVLPTHIAGIQNGGADAEAWYTLQGKRLNTKPVHTGFYLHGGKLEFVRQR